MPIAAVPAYLGQDFSSASPGLRFGMYLPLWSDSFGLLKEQKAGALSRATRLTTGDQRLLRALVARQSKVAQAVPDLLTLDAVAVAPFTTGLGNEHPLENGFAFLNPYGLPYLPGSGIKGVLRQAARELASGKWGDAQGWSDAQVYPLPVAGRPRGQDEGDGERGRGVSLSMLDVLFGRETEDGATEHVRGTLSFWDAIPQLPGDSLAVDVMTPHQSHYLQGRMDGKKSGDSTSPHDSGQPTPISFLTLPPGTGFALHVACDRARLQGLAPDLADGQRWQALLSAAFEHAFEWLGFGAKTAVGYGAMKVDEVARRRRQDEQAAAARAREEAATAHQAALRMASLSPAMQRVETFVAELRAQHEKHPELRQNPNGVLHGKARELAKAAHEGDDWSPDERRAAAEAIEQWLPRLVRVDMKDERKKLKLAALKST